MASGQIVVWDTGEIEPGTDWAKEIQKSIDKADLAIPLLSPDFMASHAVDREISALLDRHWKGQLAVLPLVVRPTNWTQIPDLASLQFFNTDSKPLAALPAKGADQKLAELANYIAGLATAIRERSKGKAPSQIPEDRRALSDVRGAKTEYFISHITVDGDFAELLKFKLEKRGIEGWVDSDRLSPGINWQEEIDDSIRKAAGVVAVMSPEARNSEYVTYEWAFAWGSGRKIIPIMLRQTSLHPRLATLQYLDFTNRSARPWSKLYEVLAATGEQTTEASAE